MMRQVPVAILCLLVWLSLLEQIFASLRVGDPMFGLEFDVTLSRKKSISVVSGKIQLDCQVASPGKFKAWVKDNFVMGVHPTLQVPADGPDVFGIYYCIADPAVGPNRYRALQFVTSETPMEERTSEMSLRHKQDISLTCKRTSSTGSYKWYRYDDMRYRFEEIAGETLKQLTMSYPNLNRDHGVGFTFYKCADPENLADYDAFKIVKDPNRHMIDGVMTNCYEHGLRALITDIAAVAISVTLKSKITFECHKMNPSERAVWYFRGSNTTSPSNYREVSESDGVEIHENPDSSVLSMKDCRERNRGYYRCIIGGVSKYASLDIRPLVPTIHDYGKSIYDMPSIPGPNNELECEIPIGDEVANAIWRIIPSDGSPPYDIPINGKAKEFETSSTSDMTSNQLVTIKFRDNPRLHKYRLECRLGDQLDYVILQSKLDFQLRVLACSAVETLTGSSGTVASPAGPDCKYRNGMDHCWRIRSTGAVVIRFSKFQVEACCDRVHIYENTESPVASKERFRLATPDVARSEFWIRGTTLVMFRTNGNTTYSGFEFTYQIRDAQQMPATGLSTAIEVIDGASGSRASHPDFGSARYPSNATLAWTILAAQNQKITIRVVTLRTELHRDVLRIFSGIGSLTGNESAVTSLSGSRAGEPFDFQFTGSVTLVFSTDKSNENEGFMFTYNKLTMEAVFNRWSGKAALDSTIRLTIGPSDAGDTVALCSLTLECRNKSAVVKPTKSSKVSGMAHFAFNLLPPSFTANSCIKSVACKATASPDRTVAMEQTLTLPKPNPDNIKIEPINPDTWTRTGLVQFRATSEAACPSVQHRCELRMASGSSLTAYPIGKKASRISQVQCVSSVVTHFALADESLVTVAGPVAVACRLLNGSFVEHRLR